MRAFGSHDSIKSPTELLANQEATDFTFLKSCICTHFYVLYKTDLENNTV